MSITGTPNENNESESKTASDENLAQHRAAVSLQEGIAPADDAEGNGQSEAPAEGRGSAEVGGHAHSKEDAANDALRETADSAAPAAPAAPAESGAEAAPAHGGGKAKHHKGEDPAKRGKHVAADKLSGLTKVVAPLEPLKPLASPAPADKADAGKQGADSAAGADAAASPEKADTSGKADSATGSAQAGDAGASGESAADVDSGEPADPTKSIEADDVTKALQSLGPTEQVQSGNQGAQGMAAGTAGFEGQTEAIVPGSSSAFSSSFEPPAPMGETVEGNQAFVAAGFADIPKKRRRRALKAFGITVGVLAAVVLVVYLVGAVVFMGRMMPNTIIGELDISMASDEEVRDRLDDIVADYQLDVLGGGFVYRATGKDIGLAIDSDGIVRAIHEDLNPWRWPLLVFQSEHDETALMAVSFNPAVYEPTVIDAVNKYNEAATPPVNATIIFDEKTSKFVVRPEEQGTQYDSAAVLAAMSAAITELNTKVELTSNELIKPTVLADDAKLIEAAELATGMVSANLTLNMGGQPVGVVNGETLSSFITINDKLEVIFREEEMNAWVDELAAGYDTVGTERTFTRADGKEVVVPAGGVYGWEIDTAALKGAILEGIKSGATAQIDVPCIDTAAVYNGVGQRDWGNRYIDVDLSEQHVRFYGDDGAIIWEADCISGSPDGVHDTVPGTWMVNNMESPSKLIGYENGQKIYETTVAYWMAFEGNGIGFHDATWQPSFGGSMYANGYGSHGCVNLSYNAAETLYGIIEIGDCVVVHY